MANSQETTARDPQSPAESATSGGYFGWWIVVAAFLNLFFVVGIIFYGFPVFYPYFVESLGFTRAQLTQGFLLGFLFAGLPFGILAGALTSAELPLRINCLIATLRGKLESIFFTGSSRLRV